MTADADGVELAHEALINSWPRLRGWMDEDRERLRHHRRLTEAARTWQELGRDPGTLYRGTHLVRAEAFFGRPGQHDELTSSERAFLTAALDAREAERRAATRTTRRARRLVAALSATLAVALIAGLVAWQQHQTSRQEATDTTARRVAEVAYGMRTTDPRTAMLLSVAAWRIALSPKPVRLCSAPQPKPNWTPSPTPGPAAEPCACSSTPAVRC